MKREAAPGRLRLHRETLRTLGRRELARVAGGTEVLPTQTLEDPNPTNGAAPRTNAWTAVWGPVAEAVCGGSVAG